MRKYLFPQMPKKKKKNLHKTGKQWLMKYVERFNVAWDVTEIIGRKAVLSDVKTAFHVYPAFLPITLVLNLLTVVASPITS